MSKDKTPKHIKLHERSFVEKPLLDQLKGLGWEIIDLEMKQQPSESMRETFTEVVMPPILREQLKVINPWLEDDQVEEVVKQLTGSFPGTSGPGPTTVTSSKASRCCPTRPWLRPT